MKSEARGEVHSTWTEQTKNGKTIGWLVIDQGADNYGPKMLACKVLGKSVDGIVGLEPGDRVWCQVDVKSNESKKEPGRWFTEAIAFGVRADRGPREHADGDRVRPAPRQEQREIRTREVRQPEPPIDDDENLPF